MRLKGLAKGNPCLAAAVILAFAGLWGCAPERPDLVIERANRNPWTHLNLNDDPATFQFAILGDRTGGMRPGVFEDAVKKLNLLQPAFVLCVGDLIMGALDNPAEVDRQWSDFCRVVAALDMPFFCVPGNHDLKDDAMGRQWDDRWGRRDYHFVYRDVLFLIVNSEDPPGSRWGHLSAEQLAHLRRAVKDNPKARWTFVFVHKPLWTYTNATESGWLDLERCLADRRYTVFAGHTHTYARSIRHGHRYITLATTGGSSKLRGPAEGEFDHITWVTMKRDGPVVANLMLDGIYSEDVRGQAE